MNENLAQVENAVQAFESEVVACLRDRLAQAVRDKRPRVDVPEQTRVRFISTLAQLEHTLYGTGDKRNLRIVSEQHDALRIRIIYIRHLLARDIPRPYVDEALQEFATRTGPVQAPAPKPEAAMPMPAAGEGWWRALLDGIVGLFGPRRRPVRGTYPAPSASARPQPGVEYENEDEMRLIYLHKLLEEDRLQLLPLEERPQGLARDIRLPGFIANFAAKDFAEAHFAVRAESIARTPEQLRAKLARREHQEDEDEPS